MDLSPLDLVDEPRLPGETVQQWVFRRLRRTVMWMLKCGLIRLVREPGKA